NTCQPVILQDYAAQPEADPLLITAGTRAALYLPILTGNTPYGVIALGRPHGSGVYTEDDLRIGILYAQLAALVIQNAQLYQKAQSELANRVKAEDALIYERDLLHTLMDNVPDFIYFKDENLRFVRINRSYAKHLGLKKPGDAVGKSEIELHRGDSGKAILAEERDLLFGKIPSLDRVESSYTKTGELRWLSATKVPLHNQKAKITGLVGITRDVTERLWVEKRLQTQYGISQILENATDLSSAANELLKLICEALAWDMGELWLVSEAIKELQLVELWHTETLDIGDWETFTRKRGFKLGDGFAGRVWAAQESVWMADVMNHPDFPPLFFAGKIGLHGAFGFGIRLGREVLGVMTFFSRVIRQPDEEIIRMFKAISSQIAQFVERRRAEEALRQSEARLNYLLRRFVPRPVAEQLMDRQQGVQLGGEEREASVLFADIRNYMRIARAITPPELMNLLNRYFGIIGRVILKFGGTINQYAGDMIMATFNAPHEQPDHGSRAVRCALEAQAALLQEKPPRGVDVPVQFGIGVNTGPVVVGYLGFEDRFDFATLGETTNLAFRFSSLAQGGQVLIGPTTFDLVQDSLVYNLLDKTTLKGSDAPIQLYEAVSWGVPTRALLELEKTR
ncbi:MAG TPA: adenylate/guanylate cyclase domain-containing protein, partial [Anaerolineales bacterium]|nr:adenylate/guanylate cyclase domain-containing protein [Anaerolineales bacterium]